MQLYRFAANQKTTAECNTSGFHLIRVVISTQIRKGLRANRSDRLRKLWFEGLVLVGWSDLCQGSRELESSLLTQTLLSECRKIAFCYSLIFSCFCLENLFSCLSNWCFKPISKIFALYDGGQQNIVNGSGTGRRRGMVERQSYTTVGTIAQVVFTTQWKSF